jgi:hypothetical protein
MRGMIYALLIALCLTGSAVRAATVDYTCVKTFLAGTAYEVGKKAKPADIEKVAERFRITLELSAQLPLLSSESVATWCSFLQGAGADELHKLAKLKVYTVDLSKLAAIDDGIGPVPFDFRRYKLATRYDGLDCRFVIADPLVKARGQFSIWRGKLTFHDSEWFIGGIAKPETFGRFNLALTEDGKLVGKAPIFLNVVDQGEVAQEAHSTVLDGKQGALGKDIPLGIIRLPVDVDAPVKFYIVGCVSAGEEHPKQYAVDWGKNQIDTGFDGKNCSVTMKSLDPDPYDMGSFLISFEKGVGKFKTTYWSTRAPATAGDTAIFAMTTDRHLLGLFDAWRMFQESGQIRPPALLQFAGKEAALSKDYSGNYKFYADKNANVGFTVARCR